MNDDLAIVLESVRRGELVRIVGDLAMCGSALTEGEGHLVLAADRATPSELDRLSRLADGRSVLAATRDRFEELGLVGGSFFGEVEDDEVPTFENGELVCRGASWTARLATAAASLARGSADLDPEVFRGVVLTCTDWGGVVNCQRAHEAAIDLVRLVGLPPAAVVCRIGGRRSAAADERRPPPTVSIRHIVDHRRARARTPLLRNGPRVRMPTRHGAFTLQAYEDVLTGQLHLALWTGSMRDPALVRIHSECLTGDLLGSLRCDCGPQLDQALDRLVQEGGGVLLYLRQEGRGIGLVNKFRTYAIQDQGYDTVEANAQIGFEADLRDYSLAALMLVDLGISSIRLITNNPRKVRGLKKHGIQIAERVPLIVEPCSENSSYLSVKRTKLGHWLS